MNHSYSRVLLSKKSITHLRPLLQLSCLLLISLTLNPSLILLPAYAQEIGDDLALVINGSGSISDADFLLQKEGIKLALANPLIFPRDGTVAFILIQYANGITLVHIPYTIIDSEETAQNLITQIDNVIQIGGCTNPGDGINRASNVFNADGNPLHRQIICLSTDGLPNCGADVATAVANAQNSEIGLERFNVIAIEDPPNYYEEDFVAFYSPYVFGCGAVTVVENSTEYANLLGGVLLPGDLQLVGLEAIQTIQDWVNSVPLVEDKTTYVRAHIEIVSGNPSPVAARLRGYRGGAELPESPLTAINSIIAEPNAADRRDEWDASLNFRLPTSWLSGTVDLEVEGVCLECMESAGTPNDCAVQVSFDAVDEMEVRFVRIQWTDAGGTTHAPSTADVNTLALRHIAIYPVASFDWEQELLIWTGTVPPDRSDVNATLEWMRFWDLCWSVWPFDCQRRYYGVMKGIVGGRANGIPGTVACGGMPDTDFAYGHHTHSHELGHTLGIHHSVNQADNGTSFINGVTYKNGYCGEIADMSAPEFPYPNATLGPMDQGVDRFIYGLDTHSMRVIDPHENFDLMSYCSGTVDSWRWISDFTYGETRNAINSIFPIPQSSPTLSTDYIIVRGLIDPSDGTLEFKPFGMMTSDVVPPMPPAGDFNLEARDEFGNLVLDVPFEPTVSWGDLPDEGFGRSFFLVPIPGGEVVSEVVVIHGGAPIESAFASPNIPSVEVIYPNGGEVLGGEQVTITWNADDADGDELVSLVQFSRDGGASWKTLVADWPLESLDVDLDLLGETSEGLISVMVSDGFNSSMDTSDGTFTTPNVPPDATIISPQDGDLYIGVQLIFFEGIALDREDGMLSGAQLSWASDLDGFLSTGNMFSIDASTLSEGNHQITLTATDSGGLTDVTSIGIAVFRLPPMNQPPVANAGEDQVVECIGNTEVTLDGTASYDPDDDPITFDWSAPGVIFDDPSSATPTGVFPLGTTTVTLIVSDGMVATADYVDVMVIDTTPPVLHVEVFPDVLWPPNHKMVDIVAMVTVEDTCDDGPTFVLTSIQSNEPDDGLGDGDCPNDIQGAEFGTPDIEFLLRAERSGLGDGRIYTIVYTASDASGNTVDAVVTVRVPHDRQGRAIASTGFTTSGTDFDPLQETFILIIPTIPPNDETPQEEVLIASSVDTENACVGNTCGAIRPVQSWLGDFDEDGFEDLALVYSVTATDDISLRSDEIDGPIGLHFQTMDQIDYLVSDIFALGAPVIISAPVTGVGDQPDTGHADEMPELTSVRISPNPFNPSTTVSFSLATDRTVNVAIYNAKGALVRNLAAGFYSAGYYQLMWDGRDNGGRSVGSGVYLLRFVAGDYKDIQKLVMLK